MKKLIILIFVLFACQKDETFCFKCTTLITTTTSGTGYASDTDTTTSTVEKCDLTEKEADSIEKGLTSTATSKNGNITVTVKSTCTCIRK